MHTNQQNTNTPEEDTPAIDGKGPAVLVYFDNAKKTVKVLADRSQVQNPDFTVALLEMALNDQKYAQQLARMQAMQQQQVAAMQDAMIEQAVRGGSLKVGRS
jgi:hypothetical protein